MLCSQCHDKIHNNLIIIDGYEETIKGNILKYSMDDKNNKKKNNKFKSEIIGYILENKDMPNITQKKMKVLTERKFKKKISTSTISKIWKGSYI